MSHEIDMSNARANVAYVGEVPWHGLGVKLEPGATIEQWQKAAGLDWKAKRATVEFARRYKEKTANKLAKRFSTREKFEGRDVLYRSDTGAPLSIVSDSYEIVQPGQVLEFYRDLVKDSAFQIEVAGALFGGRKIWALARSNTEASIGVKKDVVRPYILLATSFDGSLATIGQLTTVRVVCNNTLQMSLNAVGRDKIKVPHSTKFSQQWMKEQLGLADKAFDNFVKDAKRLAKRKVSKAEAVEYFMSLFDVKEAEAENGGVILEGTGARNIERLVELYQDAPGAELSSANGTAWGLVNAVTRFADFEVRARLPDNRFNSAQFGVNKALKAKAWEAAKKLV